MPAASSTVSQTSNGTSPIQEPTTSPNEQPRTGRGLFQSPSAGTGDDPDDTGTAAGSQANGAPEGLFQASGGLLQSQNIYSKGAPTKSDASSEQGVEQKASTSSRSSDGELVLSKSGSHADAEVRRRRLDRLHSVPSTSQQSLSPLAEHAEEDREAKFRIGQAEGRDSELD